MHALTQSRRLKIAFWYLLITQVGVAVVVYPFMRPTICDADCAGVDLTLIVALTFVLSVLYGVWKQRRWARYALFVLLTIHFLLGVGDILKLNVGGLVYLTFAAADKVAFDELQATSGLKPPWFCFWLK